MKIKTLTKAVLFDLDGTMLDTAPDFAHCLNQMLIQAQCPTLTVQHMRAWVSEGARGMVKGAFQIDESHDTFAEKICDFLALYQTHLGQFTEFFPGILALLDWLEEKGVLWGIVTNKPTRFAEPLLMKFNLLNRAQCIVYGDTLATQKPDPAPIQLACQHLNLNPKDCFYVGDSLFDAKASSSAGMPCILAEYGYIPPRTDLTTWPIFKTITQPKDMITLLSC